MNFGEIVTYLQTAIIIVLVIASLVDIVWLQIKKSNEIDEANDNASIADIKTTYKKKTVNKIVTYGIILGLIILLFAITIPWAIGVLS